MFSFYKYIAPTWYFQLLPLNSDIPYFQDWDAMTNEEQNILNWDEGYSNREISKLDIAWQAWNKGFISNEPQKKINKDIIQPTLSDNYRFVRKYFHPIWSWYVLILRLLGLYAPWKEIPAFFKNRGIQRQTLYEDTYPHTNRYERFNSELLISQPKVSVIIPTLNRYDYLKDVLSDLEKQNYSNFDVIVIDQSEPFEPKFYEPFQLDIKLIRQEEKALWLARNTAVRKSDANYLLLFDDDSRVELDWITHHMKCYDYFNADISSGVSISMVGDSVPPNYSFFRWSDQLDTGNVLIHRKVFEDIGLFDRQFEKQRYGDGEFGLRSHISGFKNISNPMAKRIHLKIGSGGLRQMGHWDGWRPKKLFAPRPIPSVLYFYRRYFKTENVFYKILVSLPSMMVPYKMKGEAGSFKKALIFILTLPIAFIGIFRSWRRSNNMLKKGPLISKI